MRRRSKNRFIDMNIKVIYAGGKVDPFESSVDKEVKNLSNQREYLHNLKTVDIIKFSNAWVDYWKSSGLSKKYLYFKNISEFLDKNLIEIRLNIALHGNYQAMDEFVDLSDPKFLFHAQPRGITVHWLAGNVTILGIFSIFSALTTKNVCLVKASSRGYEELISVLDTIKNVNTDKIKGENFAKAITVVLVDKANREAHIAMSKAADVRIAWGGHEAIETVIGLPKKLDCEDIIFGPKYSYALIDRESLKIDSKQLARKLAIDVSVFDQYACSSPHTVFVQENRKGDALAFAEVLASELEFINRTLLPKGETDPGKIMEILSTRMEHSLKGKVFSSKGTEWTVIYEENSELALGSFSRVITVKPIKDLDDIAYYNDRQKQTLGVGLTLKNKLRYLDKITFKGIDRCPDLGFLTFFESPWDGMFVFDRLVRWVTTYKA